MNGFKRSLFTIICSLLLLSACVKPHMKNPDQLQDDANASFYVESVGGGSSQDNAQLLPDWSFPVSRLYNFKACVNDTHTSEPIKGHKFVVEGGPALQNTRSDANGCVNWSESVNYNQFSDQKYVPFQRFLRADGIHTGRRELKMAIYPWSADDKVLDLSKVTVPDFQIAKPEDAAAVLGGDQSGKRIQKNLWVDDLSLQTHVNPGATDGIDLSINLLLTPKVILKDRENSSYPWAFTHGRFKVAISFVGINREKNIETRTLLGQAVQNQERQMESGKLRVELPMHISYRNTIGQLEVALKLTPVAGPSNLSDFEGVFALGDYRSLTGSASPPIKPSQFNSEGNSFKISDYVKTLQTPKDPNALPSGINKVVPFEFSYVKINPEPLQPGETATERTVSFRAETCVTDPSDDGSIVRDVEFTVVKFDASEKTVRTNQKGCFSWNDILHNKYYKPEKLILNYVTVKHSSGFTQRLGLVFNPMDMGWTFGRDIREVEPALLDEINSRKEIKSQILINSYGYSTDIGGIKYALDPYLNLKQKKTMIFTLRPVVMRYSSLAGGRGTVERIRDGVWLLKAAVYADYPAETDPQKTVQAISTVKKLVKIQNGEMNEPLEFVFDDLKVMRARNQILFELAPVDENKLDADTIRFRGTSFPGDLDSVIDTDSGLEPRTFVGPIVPFTNAAGGPLRPTDDLAETDCTHINCGDIQSKTQDAHFELTLDISKYFESIRHLSFVTVSHLISKQKEVEAQKQNSLAKMAQLDYLVSRANVEYVPLVGGEEAAKTYPALATNNKVIPVAQGGHGLLALLNKKMRTVGNSGLWAPLFKDPVTPDTITGFLANGEMSKPLAARLCRFFIEDLFQKSFTAGLYLVDRCVTDLWSQSSKDLFVVDRKLRVSEVGGYRRGQGTVAGLSVGSDFSLGYSNGESVSATWVASPFSMGVNLPLPVKWATLSGPSVSFNYFISRSTSRSQSKGTSVSVGTALHMEKLPMTVRFNKFDRCAIIRLNSQYILKRGIIKLLRTGSTDEQKAAFLNRGLMICGGQDVTTPVDMNENYYFFTPELSDGSMLDPGDIKNYPWALSLRGVHDYSNFVSLIKATKAQQNGTHYGFTNWVKSWFTGEESNTNSLDIENQPLDFLQDVVGGIMPAVPGVYTIP